MGQHGEKGVLATVALAQIARGLCRLLACGQGLCHQLECLGARCAQGLLLLLELGDERPIGLQTAEVGADQADDGTRRAVEPARPKMHGHGRTVRGKEDHAIIGDALPGRLQEVHQTLAVVRGGKLHDGMTQEVTASAFQQCGRAVVGVEQESVRGDREARLVHGLDHESVEVLGLHEGEYAIALTAAHDDGIDLALANGAQGVFRLFETGSQLEVLRREPVDDGVRGHLRNLAPMGGIRSVQG
jgi:hypothetical protein